MNTGGFSPRTTVIVDGTLSKTGVNPVFIFDGSTFTNNGSVGDLDFLIFNDTGLPKSQSLAGLGSWAPRNIQIGNDSSSTTTVTLQNDVTSASNGLVVTNGSLLNVGSHILTVADLATVFYGRVAGTGLVRLQAGSSTPRLGGFFTPLTMDSGLEVLGGTVKATGTTVAGKVTIDAGATLSLFGSFALGANRDIFNNGTLNAFSDNPILIFNGGTLTNNGTVTGSVYFNFGPQLAHNLAGTGTWAGNPRLLLIDGHYYASNGRDL